MSFQIWVMLLDSTVETGHM